MVKNLLFAVLGIICIVIALITYLYLSQTRLIHIPVKKIVATPNEVGLKFEDVWLETEDSARLHGWFIPHPDAKYTVLFFHGNAGNVSHRLDTFEILHELELAIFIYDYRSYGNSTGKLSEAAMFQDAALVWDYLTEKRGIPADKVIVMGRSLGGAIASWAAENRTPGGLIMESSFSSMVDMARLHYKPVPVHYLLKWQYDSLSRVPNIRCPVLYVHSRSDNLIPFNQGLMLYEATNARKEFLEIKGDHNYGFLDDRVNYVAGLKRFVDSLGADPAAQNH